MVVINKYETERKRVIPTNKKRAAIIIHNTGNNTFEILCKNLWTLQILSGESISLDYPLGVAKMKIKGRKIKYGVIEYGAG